MLDDLNLPLSNSNEDLETISNNYFRQLFDTGRFEIRPENLRDKGIDFFIELKRVSKKTGKAGYLNFKFAVQLKATDTKILNHDGSISLQIDTGNINYLLNNSMPAFYVLYLKSENKFYYEDINSFVKVLDEKNENWNDQPTHTLRFFKVLDTAGVDNIYNVTIEKGVFYRKLTENIVLQSLSTNFADKILIGKDLSMSNDSQIRKMVESIGLHLINEARWSEIIKIHKNSSNTIASTGIYNFILGVANYYSGNLTEALSFFKHAKNFKFNLNNGLLEYLKFYYLTVKHDIGILSDKEYIAQINNLEESSAVGLYVKLEKIKNGYTNSFDYSGNTNEKMEHDLLDIINHPNANEDIIFNAKGELALIQGYKNNIKYATEVSLINALDTVQDINIWERLRLANEFILSNRNWFKYVQDLKEEAIKGKNEFNYYWIIIYEVKVRYEFLLYTKYIIIVKPIPGMNRPEIPDNKESIASLIDMISSAYTYFKRINHLENIIATLSIVYELYHFNEEFIEAQQVIEEIEDLIEAYDLDQQNQKLIFLKNKGTHHEQLKERLEEIFNKPNSPENEIKYLVSKMEEMDENELLTEDETQTDIYFINLLPIGVFQFPVTAKEQIYSILQITPSAKKIFDPIFEIAIPVANIFYETIDEEGQQDGLLASKGIQSWRYIFKIREAFYKNKFYRVRSDI